VGKHWDTSFTIPTSFRFYQNARGQYPGTFAVSARVVSYEKVTVPAGTFDAFKIVGEEGYRDDITEYYSQKLGMIKYDIVCHCGGSLQYERHWELVSFSLAKPGS
jgi:hypothetical protein